MDTRRVFHGIFSYIPQARALPQAWLVTDPAEAWFVCIERRKQASQDILELKGEETCPEQTLQLQCRAQRHQIYDQAADEKTRTFFSRGFYKPNPGDEFLVVEDCERCMGQTAWWVIFMTFPMNKTGLLLWIFGKGPRPEKRQTGQRKIVCWDFSGGKYTPQIIALGSGVPLEGTIFFFFNIVHDCDPSSTGVSVLPVAFDVFSVCWLFQGFSTYLQASHATSATDAPKMTLGPSSQ